MEEKLFWMGIVMGGYLLAAMRAKKKNKFAAGGMAVLWHAVFCAIAAFMGAVVLAISLDNRNNIAPSVGILSLRQLVIGLAGAGIFAVWGWIKASKKIKSGQANAAENMFKDDTEWSETIFSAVILASVMMYFFVQAFKIPSGSMRMTFLEGDHLFVNKFIYGVRIPFTKTKIFKFKKIKQKDIVVFQFPSFSPSELQCGGVQYKKDFIKRVIGLPGDIVEVRGGIVYINGKPVMEEEYAQYLDEVRMPPLQEAVKQEDYQRYWQDRKLGKLYNEMIRDNFGPVTIPEKQYFVMGDNRDRSCDSRYWGSVPEELVKGKAWFVYWPPSRISGI